MRYTIKRIMAKLKSSCVQRYCLKPYINETNVVSLPVLSAKRINPFFKTSYKWVAQFNFKHSTRSETHTNTIYNGKPFIFCVKGTWNLLVNRYLIFETHLFYKIYVYLLFLHGLIYQCWYFIIHHVNLLDTTHVYANQVWISNTNNEW